MGTVYTAAGIPCVGASPIGGEPEETVSPQPIHDNGCPGA